MGSFSKELENHVCHERGLLSSFDLKLINEILGDVYTDPVSIKIDGYEFLGFSSKEVGANMNTNCISHNTVTIKFCKDHNIPTEVLKNLVPITTGSVKKHKNYITEQVFQEMVNNGQWTKYIKDSNYKDQHLTDEERDYILNY